MDPDLNNYDTEHACTGHARMTKAEWQAIYHEAWSLYYTPEHMKTLLRRAAANNVPMLNLAKYLLTFSTTDRLERVHPLQGGILRLKRPVSAGLACRARVRGRSGRASCGARSTSTPS